MFICPFETVQQKPVYGLIVGWLPPTKTDAALWHVQHLDGDEEDLDELNDFDLAVSKHLAEESLNVRKSAEATESHSWGSLKRRIEEKLETGYTGNEVFALFDRDGKGALDVSALNQGVQRLGLTLTHAEVRSILRRMTVLAGGTVNKASFFEALDIDLRVFAVDNRDSVGGERGRRPRRGRYDEEEEESPRVRSHSQDFQGILLRIREQMEVAVSPQDRGELAEVGNITYIF